MGSVKRRHWCSSQEDPEGLGSSKYKCWVPHLSNESFLKDFGDVEGVENDVFLPMYLDLDGGKNLGSCYAALCCYVSCCYSRVSAQHRSNYRKRMILRLDILSSVMKWRNFYYMYFMKPLRKTLRVKTKIVMMKTR